MIIVVEGPDNAGKTTLAQYLAKELRAVFIKVERPKRGVDLLAYQGLLQKASEYSGVVVADRHVAISEPIYGQVIRGGHDLKDEDIQLCMDQLDVVIYCRPLRATILKTLSHRPQMDGVVENTSKIIDRYDDFFSAFDWEHRARMMIYNFEFQNPQAICLAISTLITRS